MASVGPQHNRGWGKSEAFVVFTTVEMICLFDNVQLQFVVWGWEWGVLCESLCEMVDAPTIKTQV